MRYEIQMYMLSVQTIDLSRDAVHKNTDRLFTTNILCVRRCILLSLYIKRDKVSVTLGEASSVANDVIMRN